jgi:hypothetical protein
MRHLGSGLPRVERKTLGDGKSERVFIRWGGAQITLNPDEAQALVDALSAVL